MNRQKIPKTKSCEQLSPLSTGNSTRKLSQNIARVAQQVSQTTTHNNHQPQALERFIRLVKERDYAKLSAYFANYGIDPEFVKLNLDCLIEGEFQDLSA